MLKASGLVGLQGFGDTPSPIKRCTVRPTDFRTRMLMYCSPQAKTNGRRFGQEHAEVLQNMTALANVGCHSPLMTNCHRRMSRHSLFGMVSCGSARHRASEVTQSRQKSGAFSQTCPITFATYCVKKMEHFGWQPTPASLNIVPAKSLKT